MLEKTNNYYDRDKQYQKSARLRSTESIENKLSGEVSRRWIFPAGYYLYKTAIR